MKKNFTKIRSIYRRKKNRENRKKSYFWKIIRFLSNLLEYYFRLFSICRYETPCVCSYGIVKPWKKCSQKFAQYIAVKKIVNIGESQIFGKFSVFCPTLSDIHYFLTPIYSAEFCETFFHGSPTPYERTQGVSYLQMSAIGACARSYELSDMHFIAATRLIEAFNP